MDVKLKELGNTEHSIVTIETQGSTSTIQKL